MPYLTRYTVRKNRLLKAAKTGFVIDDDKLVLEEDEDVRYLFLPAFDSGEPDGLWGRFVMEMETSEDQEYKVFLYASNEANFYRKGEVTGIEKFLCDEGIPSNIKLEFFKQAGGKTVINQDDFLLYELQGRYLYVGIEVTGIGNGRILGMKVTNPGDTFMNFFPNVYIDRNSFFHRYMSVLSSVYNDFQEKIDEFDKNLDVDEAGPELLEVFASWMGIDVSGNFLDVEALRTIVKEGPELNRLKGTKKALERISEIILGEKCKVVEKRVTKDCSAYGESIYDVTILVTKFVEEKVKAQLFFLLEQFVPVRTHLQVIYLSEKSELDTYSYLDVNARIFSTQDASLDGHMTLDSNIVLSD